MPGNLAFYGMVQRVSRSSIAVGMPDGQALVMHGVAGQTDLSRCNNVLQGMGQVIEAHRRLIQRTHPDAGGTEALARNINAARDYLLKRLPE